MVHHDVLIVGGGLAGLRAAVGLCDKYDVALVSKVHPIRSHSIAAQGGINAALGNNPEGRDDTWEKHAFDTIKGSDYLADQDAVEIMCKEAINVVYEMEHWGCPFSRFPDGTISPAPLRRGWVPEDLLFGGPDRTRAPQHALRKGRCQGREDLFRIRA